MWSVFLLGVLAIIAIVGTTNFDDAYAITCSDKKEIFKFRTREAHCVTESTFDKLVERGWGDYRFVIWELTDYRDNTINYEKLVVPRVIHTSLFIELGGIPDTVIIKNIDAEESDPPRIYGNGIFVSDNGTEYKFRFHTWHLVFKYFNTIPETIRDIPKEPENRFEFNVDKNQLINNHTEFIKANGIPDTVVINDSDFITSEWPYTSYGKGTFTTIDNATRNFIFKYTEPDIFEMRVK